MLYHIQISITDQGHILYIDVVSNEAELNMQIFSYFSSMSFQRSCDEDSF